MKGENINSSGSKPRVLIIPLDWGLGHSTRCIPIINKLLNLNCEVLIGAEGCCRLLLEKEFQNITFLDIKGYRVRYSGKRSRMALKLFAQFPKIILRVYREHNWLKKIVKEYSINAVISDNRLGMYHSTVPSVYITHQLKIKTGSKLTDWVVQKIHYRFINKYSVCWVPDIMSKPNLAGELSHPPVLPNVPVEYMGPLSRLKKINVEINYDLAILLSGPEPQRTVFEELILNDLKNYDGKVLLIRGLPAATAVLQSNFLHLEIKNHLPADELSLAVQQSGLVISRCGFSTIMDLVKLQKRAILIPTPGQTEQEYLADYLMRQEIFLCIKQEGFSLPGALKQEEGFSFNKLIFPQSEFEKVVEDFMEKCRLIPA